MTRVLGDNKEALNPIAEINQGIGYSKIKIQNEETSIDNEDVLLEGIASGFLYVKDVEVG